MAKMSIKMCAAYSLSLLHTPRVLDYSTISEHTEWGITFSFVYQAGMLYIVRECTDLPTVMYADGRRVSYLTIDYI